ncbi:MAG: hypothetical protein ACD_46C00181G0037 [uncultured bacterium]|nr:MAG: hypothetical protein ACD_46C00181G0037 [uncultured bacterium]
MIKNNYKEWLISWFKKNMEISVDVVHRDFFKEGWLDSFKTIELISEIEKTFKLSFSDSHFTDARFSTIDGLAEILAEIKSN